MYIIFFLQIDKIMNNMLKQINTLSIMSKHKLSIILLIFGVFGVSFNGLIMRSISSSDPSQILFYRSLSFSKTEVSVLIFDVGAGSAFENVYSVFSVVCEYCVLSE